MSTQAYLSLGSNIGDREAHLRDGVRKLGMLGTVRQVSALYETEPREVTEQPWFLNCCVELETTLPARELLNGLLAIESSQGRHRGAGPPKGPRTLDMDILLFGREAISSSELSVPHPDMQERRFVLEPLCEIAPDAFHPVFMRPASDLLRALPPASGQVRRYPPKGDWPPTPA